MMNEVYPKVSVCMITYNHEHFIGQAIESALMQKTSFDFEIVIGEDCSTDRTRDVVEHYKAENPDRIRLLLNKENKGTVRNFADTLKACKGQYVALLEGDDYWTSSDKLEKQVDFLDSHPDYAICYHAAHLVDREGKLKVILPFTQYKKPTSAILDLFINDSFMATCSTMFRNKLFGDFPPVFFASNMMCDWSLNVLNAQYGYIGYLDEVMSVYRSNSSPSAFTANRGLLMAEEHIKIKKAFDEYFDCRYHDHIQRLIARYYYEMAVDSIKLGYFSQALTYLRQSLKSQIRPDLIRRGFLREIPQALLSFGLRSYFPGTYKFLRQQVNRR